MWKWCFFSDTYLNLCIVLHFIKVQYVTFSKNYLLKVLHLNIFLHALKWETEISYLPWDYKKQSFNKTIQWKKYDLLALRTMIKKKPCISYTKKKRPVIGNYWKWFINVIKKSFRYVKNIVINIEGYLNIMLQNRFHFVINLSSSPIY